SLVCTGDMYVQPVAASARPRAAAESTERRERRTGDPCSMPLSGGDVRGQLRRDTPRRAPRDAGDAGVAGTTRRGSAGRPGRPSRLSHPRRRDPRRGLSTRSAHILSRPLDARLARGKGTHHMNFAVGETVVYPHHGAALIEEVKT